MVWKSAGAVTWGTSTSLHLSHHEAAFQGAVHSRQFLFCVNLIVPSIDKGAGSGCIPDAPER
jgi:hypothetical protein